MALILDTDVLINYLRAKPPAIAFVESCWTQAALSVVTVGELYKGVRGDAEAQKISSMTSSLVILPMTLDIAKLGGLFSKQYTPTHGCGLLDCFIAATAQRHTATLITFNVRHFPMLPTARVPYIK